MKKLQKFLSLALVLLLVTSVSIPSVSAERAPVKAVAPAAVIAVPAAAEIIVEGIAWAMAGVAALKIAENLGKTWDNTQQGWDQLMKDAGAALTNLFAAPNWVDITSDEGKALMNAVYECYAATSGGGGKKDGKWYFEARLNDKGKIEVNTNRMDETQAVKEMGQGKDILTLSRELAQKAVGRFRGLSEKATGKLKFETHHRGKEGYLPHLHYYVHGVRLHCWSWK